MANVFHFVTPALWVVAQVFWHVVFVHASRHVARFVQFTSAMQAVRAVLHVPVAAFCWHVSHDVVVPPVQVPL